MYMLLIACMLAAAPPIDVLGPEGCHGLVPSPVDATPIRSPQAVHTAIARRVAGLDLAEIGTRNGDGMACFAHVAKTAAAYEIAPRYCEKLRSRSEQASAFR